MTRRAALALLLLALVGGMVWGGVPAANHKPPADLMNEAVCIHCHRAIVRAVSRRFWVHKGSSTIACGQPDRVRT